MAKNILIIDDNPNSLHFLVQMLMEHGYEVCPVSDGHKALKTAKVFLPNLIILDIKMPQIDGFEVCKFLKNDAVTHRIPIIFISALEATEHKIKAFSLGGADFITKPFREEEVLARVKLQLSLCSLQKNLEEKNKQLLQEIAERKKAQREMKKAKLEAEFANRSKSEFFTQMNHELRTPLNVILGHMQIFKHSSLMLEHADAINSICDNGKRLLSMINDILELTKHETTESVDLESDFDLTNFLKTLIKLIQIKAYEKGISFVYEIPPNLSRYVQKDYKYLRQVLLFLFNQAIQLTKQGQIVFKVFKRDRGHWRFQLENTKCVIPLESLPSKELDHIQKSLASMKSQLHIESNSFWFDLGLMEEPQEIYNEKKEEKATPLLFPSQEKLQELLILAKKQNLSDIKKWIKENKKTNPKWIPFIGHVEKWIKKYQFEQIIDFIENSSTN